MWRTGQGNSSRKGLLGSISRHTPAAAAPLLLIFFLAFATALAVACSSDDPTQEPQPRPTAAPAPPATPAPTPAATPQPTPAPKPTADEVSLAFVIEARDYYAANGLDATMDLYGSQSVGSTERALILLDAEEEVVLIYRVLPYLVGQYAGPGSTVPQLTKLLQSATDDGAQYTTQGLNPITRQQEPRRVTIMSYDGLVFATSHSALIADVEASVKEYVNNAIARYDAEGLDATIAYYNSEDSLDGQFYLFFIGADDIYLAYPIFPHLIGTDIKGVVGSDGQELGKEIALATEDGVWVEYLWPHPVSRMEQQKVTWAIRHDGLIFASGYYAGEPETGTPAWRDADPREYTVSYVHEAVERYEREGLESFLNYYNSVASFQGEWYLFATDENDIYHVHPFLPHLIGTDIKDVVGSDGYRLGDELAEAGEDEGVWVEYLWPHPVTLHESPKASYAVRRDGMLFASGYYVQVDDPAAQTQAYVQKAIDYYQEHGLEATVEWYNNEDSIEGQWNLFLADKDNIILATFIGKHLIGTNMGDIPNLRKDYLGVGDEGSWFSGIYPNLRSSETLYHHTWAIRYDGLLFMSRYYDGNPEVTLNP